MGMPVVTVASGGLPVVDVSSSLRGTPVTEVASGRGVPVTKVAAYGLPVVYETIGVAAPLVPTAWNSSDKTANATLSNGNLTVTASATNQGVRAVKGLAAGKYYWEATCVLPTTIATGIGLGTLAAALGTYNTACVLERATVYLNGVTTGVTFGNYAAADLVYIAVDLTARLIWFKVPRIANLWNSSAPANPATGVGGIDISTLSGALYPFAVMSASTESWTANFGATAFAGAVPSGFISGWG